MAVGRDEETSPRPPRSGRVVRALTPMKALARGFVSPLRAAKLLLRERGLKRYAILPLVVNIVFFILLFLGALVGLDAFDVETWRPAWSGWLGEWLLFLVKWLVGLVLLLVLFYFGFTTIGMVVASPFNDLLSEKVEQRVCGQRDPEGLTPRIWLQATLFSLWESGKIALVQIAVTVLALPFLFIPVVGVLPLLLVNGYFGGLGFMDVALARHFLGARHRRVGLAGRKMEVLGLGLGMGLLLAIPGLGLLMLPLGVTAATILYTEIDWQRRLQDAGVDVPPGFTPPCAAGPD